MDLWIILIVTVRDGNMGFINRQKKYLNFRGNDYLNTWRQPTYKWSNVLDICQLLQSLQFYDIFTHFTHVTKMLAPK